VRLREAKGELRGKVNLFLELLVHLLKELLPVVLNFTLAFYAKQMLTEENKAAPQQQGPQVKSNLFLFLFVFLVLPVLCT
jgi:hypothetical protein